MTPFPKAQCCRCVVNEKNESTPLTKNRSLIGVPGEIRTHDPQIRNLVLYPTELRALIVYSYLNASIGFKLDAFLAG